MHFTHLGAGTRVREAVELTRAAARLAGHAELATLLLLPHVDLGDPGAAEQDAALLAVHREQDAGEVCLLPGLPGHSLRGPDDGGLRLPRPRVPALSPPPGGVLVHREHLRGVVSVLHAQGVAALEQEI